MKKIVAIIFSIVLASASVVYAGVGFGFGGIDGDGSVASENSDSYVGSGTTAGTATAGEASGEYGFTGWAFFGDFTVGGEQTVTSLSDSTVEIVGPTATATSKFGGQTSMNFDITADADFMLGAAGVGGEYSGWYEGGALGASAKVTPDEFITDGITVSASAQEVGAEFEGGILVSSIFGGAETGEVDLEFKVDGTSQNITYTDTATVDNHTTEKIGNVAYSFTNVDTWDNSYSTGGFVLNNSGWDAEGAVLSTTYQGCDYGETASFATGDYSGSGTFGEDYTGSVISNTVTAITTFDGVNGAIIQNSSSVSVSSNIQ